MLTKLNYYLENSLNFMKEFFVYFNFLYFKQIEFYIFKVNLKNKR